MARLDCHLHAQAKEISELYAAGVQQTSIEALYPFSPSEYSAGLLRLLSEKQVVREQAQAWQNVKIYSDIVLDLPPDLREEFDLYDSRGRSEDEISPKDLPHYGKDPWCTELYLNRLLDALYEYPALLRILTQQLAEGDLNAVDAGAFGRLLSASSVLSNRLTGAHLAPRSGSIEA